MLCWASMTMRYKLFHADILILTSMYIYHKIITNRMIKKEITIYDTFIRNTIYIYTQKDI